MRPIGRLALLAGAGIVVSTAFTFAGGQTTPPPAAETSGARRTTAGSPGTGPGAGSAQMPRTPEGKPDFSGIWQALNTAAWDIQDHNSALAGYLGVPPGRGVVEGNEIPYKPEALEQKKKNFAETGQGRSRVRQVPAARRPARHVHALPVRDCPESRRWSASATSSRGRSGRSTSPGQSREWLEGWPDFWMGDSRGKWEGDTLVVDVRKLDERHLVRPRGEFPRREPARGGALHAYRPRSHSVRSDDRGPGRVHAALEDQHAALSHHRQELSKCSSGTAGSIRTAKNTRTRFRNRYANKYGRRDASPFSQSDHNGILSVIGGILGVIGGGAILSSTVAQAGRLAPASACSISPTTSPRR